MKEQQNNRRTVNQEFLNGYQACLANLQKLAPKHNILLSKKFLNLLIKVGK